MPPSPSNAQLERRIQKVESQTGELTVSMATHGMQLSAVSAKIDTVLAKTETLATALGSHVKDDDKVALRVHDLETARKQSEEERKAAADNAKALKIVIWTALATIGTDLIFKALTYFHLLK